MKRSSFDPTRPFPASPLHLLWFGRRVRRFFEWIGQHLVDIILLERTKFTVNNTSHCTHRSFNLPANIFCGQLNAISVERFDRRFDCWNRIVDQFGGIVDSRSERVGIGRWHTIVSRDSQLFVGKFSVHKMLFIRLKRPRLNVFDEVRHVGQHLENHCDFVEMITNNRSPKGFVH